MGKASKWFRGLLGLKKSDPSPQPSTNAKPPKRRWSFVKSFREKHPYTSVDDQWRVASREIDDASNHAVAVAAAKAAVAEAAIATAHAANAVVKLTSSSGRNSAGFGRRREEEAAAVKIQSYFRAYLSRRALKALKALVKLQALVKGYLVRKHAAYELRCLQAIIRAQARSRIGRSQISDSPHSSSKSSHCHHPGPPTPEKFEHPLRSTSMKHQPSLLKRNGSKSYPRADSKIKGPKTDEKGDKILEIDPGKPHVTPRRRNLFQPSEQSSHSHSHSFTTSRGSTMHQTAPSPSSGEVNSFSPLLFTNDIEEMSFFTAENSPQFYSASSKGNSSMRGPFTPNKSDGSRSCLSGYSDHPNYMSYTESSRAKVRSLSAPRQRPQFDLSGMTKRHSVYGYGDPGMQKATALHDKFVTKAYPGSGRLDRLGMPVGGGAGGDMAGYSGGFLNRY